MSTTKTRVRGWRMTYREWLELRALAREDGITPRELIRNLVVKEKSARDELRAAQAQAEAAGVA